MYFVPLSHGILLYFSSFRALSWLLFGAVLCSLLLPSLALPKRDIKTREEVMAFLYDQVN